MSNATNKPFLPRDMPKSLVIFVLAIMFSVIIAGPIIFVGAEFEKVLVENIGTTLFFLGWVVGALFWFVYMGGLFSGKYKHLQERKWKEQLW